MRAKCAARCLVPGGSMGTGAVGGAGGRGSRRCGKRCTVAGGKHIGRCTGMAIDEAVRATGIGGTDVAATLGVDDQRDLFDVWADKMGLVERAPATPLMRF